MCGISSATFVSKPISRPRPRNSKNRAAKPETNGTFVSASPSIFQILFPETGCHAKTRLPDQRLWQPARPYLLTINRHTRNILPILPSPIFKKWQNRHTNTLTPRFSRITPGCKMPTTRESVPGRLRHPSLIPLSHFNFTYLFPEIDWRWLMIIAWIAIKNCIISILIIYCKKNYYTRKIIYV